MTRRHPALEQIPPRRGGPKQPRRVASALRTHPRSATFAGALLAILTLSFLAVGTSQAAPGGASSGADDVTHGVAAPHDPVAPPSYEPRSRKGQRPHPTIGANTGGFSAAAPATFTDGVSVHIDKVTRGVEQGEGPGVFAGRPNTALTLALTNRSAQPIDLTQVVVTTTYGTPAKVAAPVYEDPAATDFSGTVAPGATATAVYVFAIPPGQARSAVTTVDFDDVHVAATFKGLGE